MNHKYFKVFTATAITACLMTSAAFAGTGTQTTSSTAAAKTTTQAAAQVQGRGPAGRDMKAGNPMDSLIKAGTITQAQADAIKTAMDAARDAGTRKTLQTILDELAKAGTITADQQTAILKAMPQHDGDGPMGGHHKNPMGDLVTAKTITQAQADAIKTAMDAARASGTNKTMQTILDELVKAGTITADQETAILKDMPQHDGNGPDGQGPRDGNHKNPMSELVTAKTITQAQADAIRTAMDAARASGTDKTMQTILDELVKAGTITADQETAILKDMPQPPQAK